MVGLEVALGRGVRVGGWDGNLEGRDGREVLIHWEVRGGGREEGRKGERRGRRGERGRGGGERREGRGKGERGRGGEGRGGEGRRRGERREGRGGGEWERGGSEDEEGKGRKVHTIMIQCIYSCMHIYYKRAHTHACTHVHKHACTHIRTYTK